MASADPKEAFPLHYHIWHNDYMVLDDILLKGKHDLEKRDAHGRTPLMLCIALDHLESARVLLRHLANACVRSNEFWTATQEAITTGDPELVKLITVHRDAQLIRHQANIVSDLLHKLRETPDFYIEMKWEFTSWLPLLSRMCPSDVCRVWKSGCNVRIDTNLVGFDGSSSWVRGHLSYIFKCGESGVVMDEVNHTDRRIYRHNIGMLTRSSDSNGTGNKAATAAAAVQHLVREPSEDSIAKKLTQPIFVTYLDTDKIEFEKSKCGILGWRTDRTESINNHQCQVYCASNVQIITLRRTEHLTEEHLHDMNKRRSNGGERSSNDADVMFAGSRGNLLTNLLQTASSETSNKQISVSTNVAESYNPNHVTLEQYLFPSDSQKAIIDVGRPKMMTAKVKTFKARLWISPEYPLSLKDQMIPIVDLMSEYSPYFHKLKEFLTKQLPNGFPLKIEIPLYHVLNACISFSNLHGQDTSVVGVTTVPISGKTSLSNPSNNPDESLLNHSSDSGPNATAVKCIIDESVFDVGKGYHVVIENSPGHYGALDDEEQMVQMAVQRSLVEYGTSENLLQRGYSLSKRGVVHSKVDEFMDPEEAWLQQAIAASLSLDGAEIPVASADRAYIQALEESRQELESEEKRRRAEEEELSRVLELSKQEK